MSASIWNPASSIPSSVNANNTLKSESQTAAAGQTLITLSLFAYQPGTGTLLVFVNGIVQALGTDYTESSSTTVTFAAPLNLGDYVLIYGFVGITVTLTATTGGVFWGGVAVGTADSIAVSAAGVLVYYNGLTVVFQAAADNTTTCTLNVSGLGSVPLVNELGQSFAKLLRTGATYTVVYNSGKFYLTKDSTFYTLGAGISLPHVGLMSIPEATWETTTSVFKLGSELSLFDSPGELNSALVKGAIKVGSGSYQYQFTGIPAQMIEFTAAGNIIFKGAAAGVVGNPITWNSNFTVGTLGIGSLTVSGPITSTYVAIGTTKGLVSIGSGFTLGVITKDSTIDSSTLTINGPVILSQYLTATGNLSTNQNLIVTAGNIFFGGAQSAQNIQFTNSSSAPRIGNIQSTEAIECGSQLGNSYIFSKITADFMANARFERLGTFMYNRLDVAQPAYKVTAASTGTPGIIVSYAAAAANPITWSDLEVFNNTTKTTYVVNLRHEAVAPVETFKDTSAAADTKIWDTLYSGTIRRDRIWNDASSVSTTYQTVTRTAHTAATVNFPLGVVTSGDPTANFINTITRVQYSLSNNFSSVGIGGFPGVWKTIGKTGSGANIILAGLDSVPSWAKVIYLQINMQWAATTALVVSHLDLFIRPQGSADPPNSGNQYGLYLYTPAAALAQAGYIIPDTCVPITNGAIMFNTYTAETNVSGGSVNVDIALRGWA